MNASDSVSDVCRQISKACDYICSLTESGNRTTDKELMEAYADARLDELEHIQIFTLKLTGMLAGEYPEEETNIDEGVFFTGELNSVKKPECDCEEPDIAMASKQEAQPDTIVAVVTPPAQPAPPPAAQPAPPAETVAQPVPAQPAEEDPNQQKG